MDKTRIILKNVLKKTDLQRLQARVRYEILWIEAAEPHAGEKDEVEEQRVQWVDTGEAFRYEKSSTSYMLAEPEEGRRLLFCSDLNEDGDNALFLYRCGEYEEPFQELDFDWLPGKEDFADIDSDGCLDLRLGRNELYIWDREKQRYRPAGTELAQYGLESAEREPEDEAEAEAFSAMCFLKVRQTEPMKERTQWSVSERNFACFLLKGQIISGLPPGITGESCITVGICITMKTVNRWNWRLSE